MKPLNLITADGSIDAASTSVLNRVLLPHTDLLLLRRRLLMLLRRLFLALTHFGVSDYVVIYAVLMILTRCNFLIVTLHLLL